MGSKKIDFYQLGNKLWNIANIFRDDTLKTTEYLEEFSYFLFLKLFDDQERQKEVMAKAEGKAFIPALPEELRFHHWAYKIINNEIEVTEAVKAVQEVFQKLAKIEDHDGRDLSLFRKLFKNHIWRIKYGPTIRDLLKQLVDLELEQNFDVMGRAYEFVVQKLGEQKQYGQYFTPRHIIHFMVDLADPDIGEMVYDPAAGTGGFILRAYEIVKNKIDRQAESSFTGIKEPTATYGKAAYDRYEKRIWDLKERHLWAVEKAPDVFKLAMMNMILHNDGKSNLYESDSLGNRAQQEHKEKYDVVLSNPPYGPLTQSRTATFTYHVKRFEALFFQHIMNALKFSESENKRSRAVVIILDKILFDNSSAFKNIRKKLLRENNLKAVFSMPAGIFQPYSGVKTTVMYFERPTKAEWKQIKNENGFATRKVMFFEVQSDGFTLSTQRRPINGAFQGENPNIYHPPCGDLPKAMAIFKKWNEWLKNPTEELPDFVDNQQVWIADIEEIRGKDLNLNPGLYRKIVRGKVKWEWIKLGDVLESFSIRNKEKENLPVYSITKEQGIVLAKEFFKENVYGKNDDTYKKNLSSYKIIEKGCFVYNPYRVNIGSIGYVTEDIKGLVSPAYVIFKVKNNNYLNESFLFYIVKSDWFLNRIREFTSGSIRDSLSFNLLSDIYIPLPPIEIQQQIVERLNKQQAIIEKTKEMEKAILDGGIDDAIFEGDWEWMELGEVVEINPESINPLNNPNKEFVYIDISSIDGALGQIVEYKLIKGKYAPSRARRLVKINDIIVSTVRPYLKGFSIVKNKLFDNQICSTGFAVLRSKENILPDYLFSFIRSNLFLNQIIKNMQGSNYPAVSVDDIKLIKIPLPPLKKQQEIIDLLDTQFKTLEHIRKLRENAQETIKIILEKEVFSNG